VRINGGDVSVVKWVHTKRYRVEVCELQGAVGRFLWNVSDGIQDSHSLAECEPSNQTAYMRHIATAEGIEVVQKSGWKGRRGV
jgi:hypothetical protein